MRTSVITWTKKMFEELGPCIEIRNGVRGERQKNTRTTARSMTSRGHSRVSKKKILERLAESDVTLVCTCDITTKTNYFPPLCFLLLTKPILFVPVRVYDVVDGACIGNLEVVATVHVGCRPGELPARRTA